MRCTPQTRNSHWPTTLLKPCFHICQLSMMVLGGLRCQSDSCRDHGGPKYTQEMMNPRIATTVVEGVGHSTPPTVAPLSLVVPFSANQRGEAT
jgi:hypothetical protein